MLPRFSVPLSLLAFCLPASLLVSGCSWNGTYSPESFVSYNSKGETEPITLGLLDKKQPNPVKYGKSVDYRFFLNNYIYALQQELQNRFEKVEVVQRVEDCPQCGMFALPRLTFRINQDHNEYDGALRVDFITADKRPLVSVSSTVDGDASPDGSTKALTVANSVSLGLLSGAAIEAYGDMITAVTQEGVNELINDVGRQVATNPYLTAQAVPSSDDSEKDTPLAVPEKYRAYASAVVEIRTPTGLGSGFYIDASGYLITNAHVVGKYARTTISTADGQELFGEVIKVDALRDLAIIKTSPVQIKPLGLDSEKDVSVGDHVLAIGSPEGLSNTFTEGIVSQARNLRGVRMIQTDASVTHGNSGGPLIRLESGKVAGVIKAVLTDNRGTQIQGFNYAISSDEVKAFLKEANISAAK